MAEQFENARNELTGLGFIRGTSHCFEVQIARVCASIDELVEEAVDLLDLEDLQAGEQKGLEDAIRKDLEAVRLYLRTAIVKVQAAGIERGNQ